MSECPRQKDHVKIKLRRMDGILVGVQADDVERVELHNCPACKTTIGRPCADAKHVDAEGRPLCGVPAEGALVVEDHKHADCPLCAEILERHLRAAC